MLCLAFLFLVAAAAPAQQPDDAAAVVDRTNVLPNSPALVKSLGDAAEHVLRWRVPAGAEEWRHRRPEVERAFRRSIGLEKLPSRTPLNPRITARHDLGDYTIENLVFESRPDFPVTANLYRPKAPANGKRPAVVCPIGHYLATGKAEPDIQARSIKLARMGFLVLVYDAIGHGERMLPGNVHHEAGYALLPLGETIAGWMVWDSMRAIDYLLTLPEVDGSRIGVTGNSGGGLNTLFTAALDSRVSAAAVVGYTFTFNNWLKYAGAHCTCTHLPGIFRAMEWFEIAGLIAPRALLMLQGSEDSIFPISGARRAGHGAAAIYSLLGRPGQARFDEVPGQPHAYSRPYRERMYGWMALHLLHQGAGGPIPEGDMQTLPAGDPRLMCDPRGTIVPRAPSALELARRKAVAALADLPSAAAREWVAGLSAPPEDRPHFLAASRERQGPAEPGAPRRVSFNSEDGEYIPSMLWLPATAGAPAATVVIVDSRGKQAVAQSGLVEPLSRAGYAVLALDLRGRGETLGRYRTGYDTNFRLIANQTLMGEPPAGRRAFDLRRALDFIATRRDLKPDDVTVVGIGEDALTALLAAAADRRIGRVAAAGYVHSFVSQMRGMPPPASRTELRNTWNHAQLTGRLNPGDYEIDFASVIPFSLAHADVPEIAALLAPRKLLFCGARDARGPDMETLVSRFRKVTAAAGSGWLRYEPARALDPSLLLEWLR